MSPRGRAQAAAASAVLGDVQLQSLFQLVDRDRSGFISRHELSQLFHSLHLPASHVDIELLIQSCDSNDDGEIDWHEFLNVMRMHSRALQRGDRTRGKEREDLLEALKAFEGPHAGVLSVDMLERAMELFHPATGESATRDARQTRLMEMIQHLQVDGAGGFHYAHVRHLTRRRIIEPACASPSVVRDEDALLSHLRLCSVGLCGCSSAVAERSMRSQ